MNPAATATFKLLGIVELNMYETCARNSWRSIKAVTLLLQLPPALAAEVEAGIGSAAGDGGSYNREWLLAVLDQFCELLEKVTRVMRPGRSLRMILHTKNR